MSAYYNEHDPYAAQWLRNLIAAGHITPGEVDERSIEDVRPSDVRGFTQCHFFAGLGVWSLALRRAGWADDRPVWTGSCPCQPYSQAGKGLGFADERHLWPAFDHLIAECEPAIILGEQVASSNIDPWIDLVQNDLEALGYAFGAVPFPAAGVGAPGIRDRAYWVAHSLRSGSLPGPHTGIYLGEEGARSRNGESERLGAISGMANADDCGRQWGRSSETSDGRDSARIELERFCDAGRVADSNGGDASAERQQRSREQRQQPENGGLGELAGGLRREPGEHVIFDMDSGSWAGPTNGFWRSADWLGCTDGKWRPVEPGTFPLAASAHGGVGRVRADWRTPAGKEGQGHRAGRLKGYGNAINEEAARVFIGCVMESI